MNIGIPPIHSPFLNEDKSLNEDWYIYISNLCNEIIADLSDNGYVFPEVSESIQDKIANLYTKSIVFNTDTNKMDLNNIGNYEEIATNISGSTSDISNSLANYSTGQIFFNTDLNKLVFKVDDTTTETITSS